MLYKLGRENDAAAVNDELVAWRKPVDCAQTAVTKAKSFILNRDEAALESLEIDIRASLGSERLMDDSMALGNLHRAMGHLAEHRGQVSDALRYFDMALGLNEGAGCLRDAKRLRKATNEHLAP